MAAGPAGNISGEATITRSNARLGAMRQRAAADLEGFDGRGETMSPLELQGWPATGWHHDRSCPSVRRNPPSGMRQRQVRVALADRGHPVPALAYRPCRRGDGHLLARHQHQRLKQQGEARKLAGPGGLDLAHRAIRQPHSGETNLEEALVLEEVQMPIAWPLCRGPDARQQRLAPQSDGRRQSPRGSSACRVGR